MSKLIDLCIKYKGMLEHLDLLLEKLVIHQSKIAAFLTQDTKYFAERDNLLLSLVQPSETLEKTKEKLLIAQNALHHTKDSENSKELENSILELQDKISLLETEIQQIQNNLKELEKKFTWIEKPFSMSYVEGQSVTDFNSYIAALNETIEFKKIMQTTQAMIAVEQRSASNAKDLAAALAWCSENVAPLSRKVYLKDEEFVTRYHYALNKAHNDAVANHLDYLADDKYKSGFQSNKYSLNDLEKFASERKVKQDYYRQILPPYVVAIIPADTHIKGDKKFGLGKTNTAEKVREIAKFLYDPFPLDRNESIAKLKKLFSNVGVSLTDDKLTRIYDNAITSEAHDIELVKSKNINTRTRR